jgi:hypothetical protein
MRTATRGWKEAREGEHNDHKCVHNIHTQEKEEEEEGRGEKKKEGDEEEEETLLNESCMCLNTKGK